MKYSADQKKIIKWALSHKDPWACYVTSNFKKEDEKQRAKRLIQIRKNIKRYKLRETNSTCCYCRTDLTMRDIMTDIEHIIPKKLGKSYVFNTFNLSVSCKTCNMTIKNNSKDHLRRFRKNNKLISKDPRAQQNYNFIHPNIHDWFEHIDYYCERVNNNKISIYYPKTSRGRFTYNFFKLGRYELYQNTKAQGKTKIRPRIYSDIEIARARHNQ